jgi:hypothetical protein
MAWHWRCKRKTRSATSWISYSTSVFPICLLQSAQGSPPPLPAQVALAASAGSSPDLMRVIARAWSAASSCLSGIGPRSRTARMFFLAGYSQAAIRGLLGSNHRVARPAFKGSALSRKRAKFRRLSAGDGGVCACPRGIVTNPVAAPRRLRALYRTCRAALRVSMLAGAGSDQTPRGEMWAVDLEPCAPRFSGGAEVTGNSGDPRPDTLSDAHSLSNRVMRARRGSGICFGTGSSNTTVCNAHESRKAQPITPRRIEVSVCRWIDFLTPGGDLSESPVTHPAICLSSQRSVLGGGGNRTNAIRAVITWTASPLSVKNLDGVLIREILHVPNAKTGNLFESVVARPALLGGAVMRIRWNVGMQILGVTDARQRHPAHYSKRS